MVLTFPRLKPDAEDKIRPTDFITKVHFPRYPRMMNPDKMLLISGIPDPAAYGAKDLTKHADMPAIRTELIS